MDEKTEKELMGYVKLQSQRMWTVMAYLEALVADVSLMKQAIAGDPLALSLIQTGQEPPVHT